MSIFGDLAELSLPDVLTMVAKRTGQLELTQLPHSPSITLNLSNEYLKGCTIDNQLINDPLVVRDKLVQLISSTQGHFEFQRCNIRDLQGHLSLNVSQLITTLITQAQEVSSYQRYFAHPQTKFLYLVNNDVWLDEEIYLFLEQARKFLLLGIDAQTLARELNMSLEQVQLYFYKLRILGQITPIRAFTQVASTSQVIPFIAVKPRPLSEPQSMIVTQPKVASTPTATKSASWGMALASKLLNVLWRPASKSA
jgi:hypothetical protein